MIEYFIVAVLLAAALSAPAWFSAQTRGTWFSWDYGTLVVPFALWFLFAGLGLGPQSLANLVEVMILLALVPLTLSIRVFSLDHRSNLPYRNSIGAFAVCTVAAVVLRLAMPLLPE